MYFHHPAAALWTSLPPNAGHWPWVSSSIRNSVCPTRPCKAVSQRCHNWSSNKQHLGTLGESARACMFLQCVCCACVCVCVCAHVTRKVWGLCVRHKRNVNTVYASPAVTSASASSLSSHLAARETPIQLDADSVSLDSHQTETHKFNPVLPWAHCFTAG